MPVITHPRDGIELHYVDRGRGHPVVLIHGLLFSSRMFVRLRRQLNDYRVILIDLRGHGLSERPTDSEMYSWETLASDVIAVLDHLEIDKAVIGGLSLGANTALVTARDYPDRCAGIIVEMPVLWRSKDVASSAFGMLSFLIHFARGAVGLSSRLLRRIPVAGSILPDIAAIRDVAALDPMSAVALMRGLIAQGLPDNLDESLSSLTMPALVIGHHTDPLHALGDAKKLNRLLPDSSYVDAPNILHYRIHPELLAEEVRPFLERVWAEPDGNVSAG